MLPGPAGIPPESSASRVTYLEIEPVVVSRIDRVVVGLRRQEVVLEGEKASRADAQVEPWDLQAQAAVGAEARARRDGVDVDPRPERERPAVPEREARAKVQVPRVDGHRQERVGVAARPVAGMNRRARLLLRRGDVRRRIAGRRERCSTEHQDRRARCDDADQNVPTNAAPVPVGTKRMSRLDDACTAGERV